MSEPFLLTSFVRPTTRIQPDWIRDGATVPFTDSFLGCLHLVRRASRSICEFFRPSIRSFFFTMDVLLVNLTTAMASVDTPSAEEYAALPAAQKAAVAAASKREVTEASLATFVQQGHYVAVLYPAAASLAAMAAATHILMFRLRPNGFTDMTVDLHSIGVISVADPAPVSFQHRQFVRYYNKSFFFSSCYV